MITSEILDRSPQVKWDDIAGLEFAKQCVMEVVVWPLQRYNMLAIPSCVMSSMLHEVDHGAYSPEWFTGLRCPPKGILLFGPPVSATVSPLSSSCLKGGRSCQGTGKTLIGKAIASESGAKFFSISASSMGSKWVWGDSGNRFSLHQE